MRTADLHDLIVGVVTIAFACIAILVLIPVGVDDPGAINIRALGPSFWPFIVAYFLLSMGVLIALIAFKRSRAPNRKKIDSVTETSNFSPGRWASAVSLLAIYYVLLDWLGMVVASVIALAAFTLFGGERRPVVIVILSVALPIALYLFFRYVANVAIPHGIFENWIG